MGNRVMQPVLRMVVMVLIPGIMLSSACISDTSRPSDKSGGTINLSSDAFRNGGELPPVYTCKGQDISPRLTWEGVPAGTKSVTLVMDDPDAPGGTFSHWILYNLPPETRVLPAAIPANQSLPDGSRQGINDFRRTGYSGPCPPPGKSHRYYFRLFALDIILPQTGSLTRETLLKSIEGHVIAKGEIMGFFKR